MTEIDKEFVDVLSSIAHFIKLTGDEVMQMKEGLRHLANAMQCMHKDIKALKDEANHRSSNGNSE